MASIKYARITITKPSGGAPLILKADDEILSAKYSQDFVYLVFVRPEMYYTADLFVKLRNSEQAMAREFSVGKGNVLVVPNDYLSFLRMFVSVTFRDSIGTEVANSNEIYYKIVPSVNPDVPSGQALEDVAFVRAAFYDDATDPSYGWMAFFNTDGLEVDRVFVGGGGGGGTVHAPYIGENGNWFEWDDAENKYEDSGISAQGPKGDQGENGGIPEAEMDGHVYGRKDGGWELTYSSLEIDDKFTNFPVQEAPVDSAIYGRRNNGWTALPAIIPEAPSDGKQYARQNQSWQEVTGGSGGIIEAPEDGKTYGRKDGTWTEVVTGGGISDAPSDSQVYGRIDGAWQALYTKAQVDSLIAAIPTVQEPFIADFVDTNTFTIPKPVSQVIDIRVLDGSSTIILLQDADWSLDSAKTTLTISTPAPGSGKKIKMTYSA